MTTASTGDVHVAGYDQVAAHWFQGGHVRTVEQANGENPVSESNFVGPTRSSEVRTDISHEWIVRLTESATKQIGALTDADDLLDGAQVNFDIVRGLGLPGMLLVESFSATSEVASHWLEANPFVSSFTENVMIRGAQVPDDPRFPDMSNLDNQGQDGSTVDADIDAPEAWDRAVGDSSVVIGIIDSGVDSTHRDLFLNIWINQGEIPSATNGALSDADGDGLITFWDLNNLQMVDSRIYVASTVVLDGNGDLVSGDLATPEQLTTATPFGLGANGSLVQDANTNGRIDAEDLLGDARWANTIDGDQNGFVDDLFGWNFQSESNEPYAENDPRDSFGHGTHIAGTIGAVSNNGTGIAGINWQSSIMSVKFLDAQNRGTPADAIAAINYATMMRSAHGVNVRVTNNSWQQPGGENTSLLDAIEASGDAGILFVSAAGNGDTRGFGGDLDRVPAYPASYSATNQITVAAAGDNDELAAFSNYGEHTIDVAAPGVGVLSTLPGDRYGTANGTSSAAAHVTGTAALIWSARPTATVGEVREAILSSVDLPPALNGMVTTNGRLNANAAIASEVFTPVATVVATSDVISEGGTSHQFTLEYQYHAGIDAATIGNDDIRVVRQWGSRDEIDATLKQGSIQSSPDGKTVRATYEISAIGGTWDILDYGSYSINVLPESIASTSGQQFVTSQTIHSFLVKIRSEDVIYVTSGGDSVDASSGDGVCADVLGNCSLRAATQEANAAAPAARTIILTVGMNELTIAHQTDETSTFPDPNSIEGLGNVSNQTGWSNETSGDLDITGSITIAGNSVDLTQIVGDAGDRIFKVHPSASLTLRDVTVAGGRASADQGGGGILSAGNLELYRVSIQQNRTADEATGIGGGGIAVWDGSARIQQSTISGNTAQVGGGLLIANSATASISQSTFVENTATAGDKLLAPDPAVIGGGGIVSLKSGRIDIENTTLSANTSLNASGAALGIFSLVPRVVVTSDSGSEPIPDQGMLVAEIDVDGFDDVLNDINVEISIEHPFLVDLDAFLVSPAGTRVELFTGVGGSGNNFSNTILDSDALASILNGEAPFTGLYRPEGDLADFAGEDPNGTWRLELSDTAVSDMGNLLGWSLDLEASEGTSAEAFLDHVTTGFHEGDSALAGRIRIHNSLVAEDLIQPVTSSVVDRGFNIIANTLAIGDLQDLGGSTFVHPVMAGSAAIDGADPDNFLATDQIGNLRPLPGGSFLTRADVGAVEMATGFASGFVFVDRDGDTFFDMEESGLPGLVVFVDQNANGILDPDEQMTETASVQDIGAYTFKNLNTEPLSLIVGIPDGWSVTRQNEATDVRLEGEEGIHFAPSLSFDGSSIAFFSQSSEGAGDTALLVLDRDTNAYFQPRLEDQFSVPPAELPYTAFDEPSLSADGRYAVFVNEFINPFLPDPIKSIDVVDAENPAGVPAGQTVASEFSGFAPSDGMVSDDGRYVTFTSNELIYVFDRQTSGIEIISTNSEGVEPNGPSLNASVSGDGRFVSFESMATDLVDDDLNGSSDVFIVDQTNGDIELVSLANNGSQSNADALRSALSSDGRFVAFDSAASSLVDDDDGAHFDIFVVDRGSNTLQRISNSTEGGNANGDSQNAALSGNGRFIVFESSASNLIDDDSNGVVDVFLYDSNSDSMLRIAESSHSATISGDGRFIAYVSGDDVFIERNPLANPGAETVVVRVGDTVQSEPLGLIPDLGRLEGFAYNDRFSNGIRDVADPGLEAWTVFLDLSGDGQLDEGEPSTQTLSDGSYAFENLVSYAEYEVTVVVPNDWMPAGMAGQSPQVSVFVDAGADVQGVDFGFLSAPENQSSDASVSGLVFRDNGGGDFFGDGIQQSSESPITGLVVFLDANDDGVLQADEPSTLTDENGIYSFTGLASGSVTVRVVPDEGSGGVTAPIGNTFVRDSLAARFDQGTLGGVQQIQLIDLTGDQIEDLVAILYESNQITIREGDGNGGFASDAVNLSVHPLGTGPIAFASGDLNQQGSEDLVVANQLSGNVVVLLDFDGSDFGSVESFGVGSSPSDVVIGDFDGVNGNDIAVTNSGSNSLTLLANQGDGVFTDLTLNDVGKQPSALVTGHFDDDLDLDIAISNFGNHPNGADLGDVAILINQGGFAFDSPTRYAAGFGPSDIVAADFNKDDRIDLAIAGFLSNSVSFLMGQEGGEFTPLTGEVLLSSPAIELEVVDIDNDGDSDLLVTGGSERPLAILPNELSGQSFSIGPVEPVQPAATAAAERTEVAIGMLDDDQLFDLVMLGDSGEIISLLAYRMGGTAHRALLDGTEMIVDLDFGLLPVVDSIVLTSEGETVDMELLEPFLQQNVKLIDIRGTGTNTLIIHAATLQDATPDSTLIAIADEDDVVVFDQGWEYIGPQTVDGKFERLFSNGSATLRLVGPRSWTNPILATDVNHNGTTTASDALAVINALAVDAIVEDGSKLVDPTTIDPTRFKFYDVNQDGNITALDALFIINRISVVNPSGESLTAADGENVAELVETLAYGIDSNNLVDGGSVADSVFASTGNWTH